MSGRRSPAADAAFRLRLPDGRRFSGPIVDLRGVSRLPSRRAFVDAVRGGGPVPAESPAIHAPAPSPVHEHVALLTPDASIDRRAALADVAAARGVGTAHDAALAEAWRELRASSSAPVDAAELRRARRRAAEAGSETERLRERAATVRGRVTALRDADGTDAVSDALAAAESSLSEVTRRLSEAATERVAAEQRLSDLEARARTARDRRGARLRLEDRVGNLERRVRAARVAAVEDEFAAARDRVTAGLDADSDPAAGAKNGSGGGLVGHSGGPNGSLPDALAVARLAPLRAPVVVASAVVAALGGGGAAADLISAPLVIR